MICSYHVNVYRTHFQSFDHYRISVVIVIANFIYSVTLGVSCWNVVTLRKAYAQLCNPRVSLLFCHTIPIQSVDHHRMSAFLHTSLNWPSTVYQDSVYVIFNPCLWLVHMVIDNLSLLAAFVLLFWWVFQTITFVHLRFCECRFHVFDCRFLFLSL